MSEDRTPQVYVCDAVAGVEALYPYLRDEAFKALPIAEQLDRQANTLAEAHAAGDRRIAPQIQSWFPGAARTTVEALLARPFSLDDAKLTIAREYGFGRWGDVLFLSLLRHDPTFEAAVDAVITGDLATLRALLDRRPNLVTNKSAYGHRATLLHYIAANGVETWRQRTPLNAVEVAALLLERGADPAAKANMYGGGQKTLGLVETSDHPHHAGVTKGLVELLKNGRRP